MQIYLEAEETERPLPPELLPELSDIAVHDNAFGPRFQARLALKAAEAPVPMDIPGGTYAFKVWHEGIKRTYRTIDLRSEQTLDDLHLAIQQAMRWDADHLYSFYLNGKLYDERYVFASPFEEERPSASTTGRAWKTKRRRGPHCSSHREPTGRVSSLQESRPPCRKRKAPPRSP